MSRLHSIFLYLLFILTAIGISSCSSDDDPAPRNADDILGVWTDGNGRYLDFLSETNLYDLRLTGTPASDPSYTLMHDSYFYEPGYNFVILLDFMKGMENEDAAGSTNWEDLVSPDVFEVTTLDASTLRWCWVDNLTDEKYKGMTKKQIIGRVIQEADKGFTLLPQNYQTWTRVAPEDFNQIIEDYEIWELMDE
ncbi:MAG: hypothetical protein K2M10_04550 [Muribaculaceae bacterium]|nr:hypothetical protein [Muribaculaceae bacterium]